jgi:hypothetical protein
MLPAGLPAGRYTVTASQPGGLSVTTADSGALIYTAAPGVGAILNNAGSAAGGGELTLRAAGAGFNATSPAANVVLVGGRRCEVVNGSVAAGELRCRVPGVAGLVLAEYWRLGSGTYSLPDLRAYTLPREFEQGVTAGQRVLLEGRFGVEGRQAFELAIPCCQGSGSTPLRHHRGSSSAPRNTLPNHPPPHHTPPDATALQTSIGGTWGYLPPPDLGQSDFWAGRFSFSFVAPAPANFTFRLIADDLAALYVNGRLAGSTSSGPNPFTMCVGKPCWGMSVSAKWRL